MPPARKVKLVLSVQPALLAQRAPKDRKVRPVPLDRKESLAQLVRLVLLAQPARPAPRALKALRVQQAPRVPQEPSGWTATPIRRTRWVQTATST